MRSAVQTFQARSRHDGSLHDVVAYRALGKSQGQYGGLELSCVGPVDFECDGFDYVKALFTPDDQGYAPIGFRCMRGNEPDQTLDIVRPQVSSQVTIDHSGRHVPAAEENRTK